jgi:hypothetical protein
MEWTDSSDKTTRFFTSESQADMGEESLRELFQGVLGFCSSSIVGRGNAAEFDSIFFEAVCDSGRLIVALGTKEGRETGNLDGCAVYLRALQDYWYDLRARNLPGSEFTKAVAAKEGQLAGLFGQTLANQLKDGSFPFTSPRLFLVAYGSEPDEILFEQQYGCPTPNGGGGA